METNTVGIDADMQTNMGFIVILPRPLSISTSSSAMAERPCEARHFFD